MPSEKSTIHIKVAKNKDLDGHFSFPIEKPHDFHFKRFGPKTMKEMPTVGVNPNGHLKIAGEMEIQGVPGFGTVTFSGVFEIDNGGGQGNVRWTGNQESVDCGEKFPDGEDEWTSQVTRPLPLETKTYA